MTEKTAQEIIDLLTLNGRKAEHIKNGERVVYLSDAISIVRKALMTDHQPAFKVGEYYSLSDSLIAKVLKTSEGVCAIRVYSQNEDKFWDDHMAYRSLWGETRKPATAEQIATFQRAEHFASKGRKLDEFKTDDVCIFRNEVVLIQELDNADDLWFYGNQFGEEYLPKEELRHLTLIQTAEELQEVGENE